MTSLSVIIITKNEERHIGECIRSVQAVANEIIVLDSGSTDQTAIIAQSLGARVTTNPDWPGFGIQKNRALSMATCDWVLSIDADERLSEELRSQITQHLAEGVVHDGYLFHRLSWYCGKQMRYSGWQNDHILRLFKRGSASFTNDLVHEKLVFHSPSSSCALIPGVMEHFSFERFEQVIDKINRYSSLWAEERFAKGRRTHPLFALSHGLAAFLRTYIFQLGFLDGFHGLLLAISNAQGAYYKYIKLWHLEHLQTHQTP
jgi:glycosyltransferase involved in cell wall biosynthesis